MNGTLYYVQSTRIMVMALIVAKKQEGTLIWKPKQNQKEHETQEQNQSLEWTQVGSIRANAPNNQYQPTAVTPTRNSFGTLQEVGCSDP